MRKVLPCEDAIDSHSHLVAAVLLGEARHQDHLDTVAGLLELPQV